MTINGYAGNYNQLMIYNDNEEILFTTERPNELLIDITVPVRSARKLLMNKRDCFEIRSDGNNTYLFGRNGKDLYVHTSVIDVVNVEEKVSLKCYGETCYKDVYTLRLNYLDGSEIKVESDYYTRTEKTEDRQYRERLAEIITECLFDRHHVSHYEVERMLSVLDIRIKTQ